MSLKNCSKLVVSLLVSLPFTAQAMDRVNVIINNHPVNLEAVKTSSEYSKGLMGRKSLPSGHGMLFAFDPKVPVRMWMKNTDLSLDMLFIGPDYRIKCILEHTKPLSLKLLSCDEAVAAVIELNAGEVKQFQVKKGMEIKVAS